MQDLGAIGLTDSLQDVDGLDRVAGPGNRPGLQQRFDELIEPVVGQALETFGRGRELSFPGVIDRQNHFDDGVGHFTAGEAFQQGDGFLNLAFRNQKDAGSELQFVVVGVLGQRGPEILDRGFALAHGLGMAARQIVADKGSARREFLAELGFVDAEEGHLAAPPRLGHLRRGAGSRQQNPGGNGGQQPPPPCRAAERRDPHAPHPCACPTGPSRPTFGIRVQSQFVPTCSDSWDRRHLPEPPN